jgi:hypothetical protein
MQVANLKLFEIKCNLKRNVTNSTSLKSKVTFFKASKAILLTKELTPEKSYLRKADIRTLWLKTIFWKPVIRCNILLRCNETRNGRKELPCKKLLVINDVVYSNILNSLKKLP